MNVFGRITLVFVGATALVFGLTSVFHTEPIKAAWSGWTDTLPGYNHVSEVVTLNVDSLGPPGYCELFSGQGSDAQYQVSVYSYPNGIVALASGDTVDNRSHVWIRCRLDVTHPESLVRGRRYEFRWSRANGARIQYYFDEACGYGYGQMIAPYPPLITPSYGLAMRCYGRMRPVDSCNFGADEVEWWNRDPNYHFNPWTLAAWTESAHVKTVRLDVDWHQIQCFGRDSWDFSSLDSSLRSLDSAAGCRIVGLLTQVPDWASTRKYLDSATQKSTWSYRCPPRRLEFSAADTSNNHLVRFLRRVIAHCDSHNFEIRDWELLNEVNSEETVPGGGPGCLSWWMHPNLYYIGDSIQGVNVSPGLHDMCSLYVRYAVVAESAIHAINGHDSDRIVVNSLNHLNAAYHYGTKGPIYSGKEWLEEFYDVVEGCNLPHFWNAISAHPYQEDGSARFDPSLFEASAETLRSIMRAHGDYGELWNTEFSLPGVCYWDGTDSTPPSFDTLKTPEQEADVCCETFTLSEGMKSLPGGCFDRNYWWLLRAYSLDGLQLEALWGLHGDSPNVPLWAFKQTAEQLTGKRFNGRVMVGGTKDDSVRVYEFEDTTALKRRTWVCWQNAPATTPPPTVAVRLPARSDTMMADSLAYDNDSLSEQDYSAASGWLHENLLPRPVFITEMSDESRPDLVMDSVRYLSPPYPVAVKAWAANRGSRLTPLQQPGNQPYPTWAVLYANGDSVAQQVYTDSIAASEQVLFEFSRPVATPDTALLSVQVNPGQSYVELGTDDNNGYRLKAQP